MCEFHRQLTIFCQDGIAVQPSAIPSCCNGSSGASSLLSEVSTVRVMCKQCLSSVNQSWCIPGLGLKYCDGMLPFVLEGYLLLPIISGDCTQRKVENIGMSVLNCMLEYTWYVYTELSHDWSPVINYYYFIADKIFRGVLFNGWYM